MAKLTKETRDALPASDFAVPSKRAIPIHDADHTRMAWGAVNAAKDLSEAERKAAHSAVIARAKTFDINTSDWEAGRLNVPVTLQAMALNISTDDNHPNKMPFEGVLTHLDKPSDAAPEGSGGRLITISAGAAERALSSLLGMGVNYTPNFDGHAACVKIGLITEATIEGKDIVIKGFIYASDFPEAAAEIKASKDKLGFSYEARELYTNDPDANPVVITDCKFTGAAILLKAKAAYKTTSIKASAEKGILDMNPEELKALLAASLKPFGDQLAVVSASVAKLEADKIAASEMVAKVEPLAASLEASATTMEAAGVNADHLRSQASAMRAEAAAGRMPKAIAAAAALAPAKPDAAAGMKEAIDAATKPLTDALAAMTTQVADLKAAAVKGSPAPERKTLTPQITGLLARAGIEMPKAAGEMLDMAKVDLALKDMPVSARLQAKTGLKNAGLLA